MISHINSKFTSWANWASPLGAAAACAGALLMTTPRSASAAPDTTLPAPAMAAPVTVLQLPRLLNSRPFNQINNQAEGAPGLAGTPGGAAAGGADEEEKTYHILKVNHIYVGGIANLFQNAGHIETEDFLKEQDTNGGGFGGGQGGFGGGGFGGGGYGGQQGGFGGGGIGGFGGGGIGGFGGGGIGGGFGGGGFGGGGFGGQQGGFGGGFGF